jgi:uncharacterized Zn-finger protein
VAGLPQVESLGRKSLSKKVSSPKKASHLSSEAGTMSKGMKEGNFGGENQDPGASTSSFSLPADEGGQEIFQPLGKRFCCEYCGRPFATKYDLKKHTRTHTKEKPYVCKICSRAFAVIGTLRCHERTHTGERPFKCKYPDCDKTYRQWLGLEHHVNTVHIGKRDHLCDKCGMGFPAKSSLNNHVRTHNPKTDEKPFQCEYCVKAFRTKDSLTLHRRVHTGEKPFKCKHCDRYFSSCSVRIVHERIHTGEKPYKCDHCGKAFRQRGPLVQHLNIHTGERPYKCTFCDKSFAAKATVRNHEKMHKRETGD